MWFVPRKRTSKLRRSPIARSRASRSELSAWATMPSARACFVKLGITMMAAPASTPMIPRDTSISINVKPASLDRRRDFISLRAFMSNGCRAMMLPIHEIGGTCLQLYYIQLVTEPTEPDGEREQQEDAKRCYEG